VRCIEDGYLQGLIADEAFKIHHEIESGEDTAFELGRSTWHLPRPNSPPGRVDSGAALP